MLQIYAIERALIPVNGDAASEIADRNYDEFQGDHEIFQRLKRRSQSILRVTMSHCVAGQLEDIIEDGSEAALERSRKHMGELVDSPLTRTIENALWIYEIVDPNRPGVRQIGFNDGRAG